MKERRDLLCRTVWDLQDGETILMGTVEGGVGIPRGTEHPFLHGDLQRKKKRFVFSKGKPISFENN
jgi:hypothetical protein